MTKTSPFACLSERTLSRFYDFLQFLCYWSLDSTTWARELMDRKHPSQKNAIDHWLIIITLNHNIPTTRLIRRIVSCSVQSQLTYKVSDSTISRDRHGYSYSSPSRYKPAQNSLPGGAQLWFDVNEDQCQRIPWDAFCWLPPHMDGAIVKDPLYGQGPDQVASMSVTRRGIWISMSCPGFRVAALGSFPPMHRSIHRRP